MYMTLAYGWIGAGCSPGASGFQWHYISFFIVPYWSVKATRVLGSLGQPSRNICSKLLYLSSQACGMVSGVPWVSGARGKKWNQCPFFLTFSPKNFQKNGCPKLKVLHFPKVFKIYMDLHGPTILQASLNYFLNLVTLYTFMHTPHYLLSGQVVPNGWSNFFDTRSISQRLP